MSPDFDEIIDRRGTHSSKWDAMEGHYGVSPADGIPMWVADMDFRPPQAVQAKLEEIAAHGVYGYDSTLVIEALMERESLGPTGVGNGVALPHARLAEVTDMSAAFILLEKPVDFDAVDRQPVDIVFAIFAPEEAGVEHLKALALVSRTLRDATLCNKLRANPDPATLHAIHYHREDVFEIQKGLPDAAKLDELLTIPLATGRNFDDAEATREAFEAGLQPS